MDEVDVDADTLGQLRASLGDKMVDGLVASFFTDAQSLLADIAGHDAVVVRRAAHTLKSTAAVFGARRVAHLAETIEHNPTCAASRHGDLQAALQAARQHLLR